MNADLAGSNPRLFGLSAGTAFPLLPPLPPVKSDAGSVSAPGVRLLFWSLGICFALPAFPIRTQSPSLMSNLIKAFAALGKGQTLQPFEYDAGPLKPEQIEIKVSH